jgi:hypothetical protein
MGYPDKCGNAGIKMDDENNIAGIEALCGLGLSQFPPWIS